MHSFKTFLNETLRIKLGQKQTDSTKNFMDDYNKSSQEHPFDHRSRILHGTNVHVSPMGNSIHVHDIQTHEPKSGNGTKALKHLTSLSDKHGVKVELHAKAYSSDSRHITRTKTLQKWYKKHGFQHDDHDEDHSHGSDMTYYPK